MTLHLFVPGLLARLPEWRRDYGWVPQAPGLEALLSGAAPEHCERKLYAGVGELLGVSGGAAAFRRLWDGRDEEGWWCADPVHLRADVDAAIMIGGDRVELKYAEAEQLSAELMDFFAADGWQFEVTDAVRWYARPPAKLQPPDFPGPQEIMGRDVGFYFRNAEQSSEWKRFYSELQMILMQSSVNRGREIRSLSAINALWFWGAGAWRRSGDAEVASLLTEDAVLAGMAHAAGIPMATPEPGAALSWAGNVLVHLDELHAAAAYDDMELWNAMLARLDESWFAPLAHALEQRRADAVVLHADGKRWEARRRRGIARWRRRTPLLRSLGLADAGG